MAMTVPVVPIIKWNVACHQTQAGLENHSLIALHQTQKHAKYIRRTAVPH